MSERKDDSVAAAVGRHTEYCTIIHRRRELCYIFYTSIILRKCLSCPERLKVLDPNTADNQNFPGELILGSITMKNTIFIFLSLFLTRYP